MTKTNKENQKASAPSEAVREQKLHNIYELSAAISGNSHRDKKQSHVLAIIAKNVFKGTTYGVSVQQSDEVEKQGKIRFTEEAIWGISISAIVEGTDIEVPVKHLAFPFTNCDFWHAIEATDMEARDADFEQLAQEPYEEPTQPVVASINLASGQGKSFGDAVSNLKVSTQPKASAPSEVVRDAKGNLIGPNKYERSRAESKAEVERAFAKVEGTGSHAAWSDSGKDKWPAAPQPAKAAQETPSVIVHDVIAVHEIGNSPLPETRWKGYKWQDYQAAIVRQNHHISAIEAELERVKQQRDGLLVALKRLSTSCEHRSNLSISYTDVEYLNAANEQADAQVAARAAIAAVEGRASK